MIGSWEARKLGRREARKLGSYKAEVLTRRFIIIVIYDIRIG